MQAWRSRLTQFTQNGRNFKLRIYCAFISEEPRRKQAREARLFCAQSRPQRKNIAPGAHAVESSYRNALEGCNSEYQPTIFVVIAPGL